MARTLIIGSINIWMKYPVVVFITLGSLIYAAVYVVATNTSCPCGWINLPSTNIIGGNDVSNDKYPFIATLFEFKGWKKTPVCSATIITSSQVVTAAHCINRTLQYSVLVGVTDLSKAGNYFNDITAEPKLSFTLQFLLMVSLIPLDKQAKPSFTDYKNVIKKEMYPTFNENNFKNDIAVLTISPPLDFSNKNIGPVCLPQLSSQSNLLPSTVTVLGWGKPSGTVSGVLQEVATDIVDSLGCAKEYSDLDINEQFCTYDVDKGPIKGDSGGPALWWDPEIKAYTLVGIISKGPSSEGSMPVIYTKLPFPEYLDWIQHLSDGKVCTKDINENSYLEAVFKRYK